MFSIVVNPVSSRLAREPVYTMSAAEAVSVLVSEIRQTHAAAQLPDPDLRAMEGHAWQALSRHGRYSIETGDAVHSVECIA